MPRDKRKYDVVGYFFRKVAFHIKFKDDFPQCAGCREVSAVTFSEDYYFDWMLENVCGKCEKFTGGLNRYAPAFGMSGKDGEDVGEKAKR